MKDGQMRSVLEQAVERAVMSEHDGNSGARLERVRLADGTRLVVKYADPASDVTMALPGTKHREWGLWTTGVLAGLPTGVGHAILDVWEEDGVVLTVMRDVGDSVPGWTRVLTVRECDQIVSALTAMHATFAGRQPPGLCPLATRLGMLSPRTMAPLAQGPSPIPGLVLRGWERFADLVEPGVADAVFALHEDPTPLASAMEQGPTTLLHGDLWPVNLAIEPNRVVLLDWALATTGPAALDLAIFLTGSAAHMEPSREELIELFRIRSAELTDDRAMDLALVAGLAEMGWNKALDAVERSDPALRARERADLDWWALAGKEALHRWSI